MFVWLGSGHARKRGVKDKGFELLDEAARAGLPVPAGAVLLDEFYRFAIDKDLAQPDGRRVVIPDAELWHNTLRYSIRLPRFGRPVCLRAANGLTVGQAAAPATDFDDPLSAASAVAAAWSTWPANGAARRDVLLIEAIPAAVAGTATSTTGATADPVRLRERSGFGHSLTLARLDGWRRPDVSLPPYARRLQQLLRGARRTFGPGNWQVDWADDGQVCWLLGVEPLTAGLD